MSKFYVESGSVRQVLDAESIEMAALSLIDLVMKAHVWIYDDSSLSDDVRRDHLMVEALCCLDATITISEIGFERGDAAVRGTPEMVDEWHLLMTRLSDLYVAAGLPPRALPCHGHSQTPSLAT
ncbi:MAG: hypothetical protein VXZ38_00725 [Planctomycetota bacterium]|nr:hypothetical protein [Planctomycetota bacterium]